MQLFGIGRSSGIGGGSGGASTFDQLGSGTNTSAMMTLGTGSELTSSGTGIVNANQIAGVSVGTPSGTGNVVMSSALSAAQATDYQMALTLIYSM